MVTDEDFTKLKSKVSRLYTHLNLEEDPPPPPPSTLPAPTSLGNIFSSPSGDCFAYNPQIYINGTFHQYMVKDGRPTFAVSGDGVSGWSYIQTNAPLGSICYNNNMWLGNAHRWIPGTALAETMSYASNNGVDWAAVAVDRNQTCGEDRNLLWDEDSRLWRCYIRKQPKPRTIAYMESFNGRIWSTALTKMVPDPIEESKHQQYYHNSVIKTPRGFFGLLNVYHVGNAGQDVEQTPPYTADEHTIDVYLVHSNTGDFTTWRKLNNGLPFLTRRGSEQQLFAWWSIINNRARIVDAVSDRKHTTYENTNANGRFYHSRAWEILLTDLYLYL